MLKKRMRRQPVPIQKKIKGILPKRTSEKMKRNIETLLNYGLSIKAPTPEELTSSYFEHKLGTVKTANKELTKKRTLASSWMMKKAASLAFTKKHQRFLATEPTLDGEIDFYKALLANLDLGSYEKMANVRLPTMPSHRSNTADTAMKNNILNFEQSYVRIVKMIMNTASPQADYHEALNDMTMITIDLRHRIDSLIFNSTDGNAKNFLERLKTRVSESGLGQRVQTTEGIFIDRLTLAKGEAEVEKYCSSHSQPLLACRSAADTLFAAMGGFLDETAGKFVNYVPKTAKTLADCRLAIEQALTKKNMKLDKLKEILMAGYSTKQSMLVDNFDKPVCSLKSICSSETFETLKTWGTSGRDIKAMLCGTIYVHERKKKMTTEEEEEALGRILFGVGSAAAMNVDKNIPVDIFQHLVKDTEASKSIKAQIEATFKGGSASDYTLVHTVKNVIADMMEQSSKGGGLAPSAFVKAVAFTNKLIPKYRDYEDNFYRAAPEYLCQIGVRDVLNMVPAIIRPTIEKTKATLISQFLTFATHEKAKFEGLVQSSLFAIANIRCREMKDQFNRERVDNMAGIDEGQKNAEFMRQWELLGTDAIKKGNMLQEYERLAEISPQLTEHHQKLVSTAGSAVSANTAQAHIMMIEKENKQQDFDACLNSAFEAMDTTTTARSIMRETQHFKTEHYWKNQVFFWIVRYDVAYDNMIKRTGYDAARGAILVLTRMCLLTSLTEKGRSSALAMVRFTEAYFMGAVIHNTAISQFSADIAPSSKKLLAIVSVLFELIRKTFPRDDEVVPDMAERLYSYSTATIPGLTTIYQPLTDVIKAVMFLLRTNFEKNGKYASEVRILDRTFQFTGQEEIEVTISDDLLQHIRRILFPSGDYTLEKAIVMTQGGVEKVGHINLDSVDSQLKMNIVTSMFQNYTSTFKSLGPKFCWAYFLVSLKFKECKNPADAEVKKAVEEEMNALDSNRAASTLSSLSMSAANLREAPLLRDEVRVKDNLSSRTASTVESDNAGTNGLDEKSHSKEVLPVVEDLPCQHERGLPNVTADLRPEPDTNEERRHQPGDHPLHGRQP